MLANAIKHTRPMHICMFLLMSTISSNSAALMPQTPSVVKIVKHAQGYQLLRNGQPYYIKGGAGTQAYVDELAAAGGNSIRSFGGTDALELAQRRGLTVLAGLSVGAPRQGFNYTDPGQVRKQAQNIRSTIERHKTHPALLMWALGNELELEASETVRIRLWKNVNELARIVKHIDPNHPVIVVIADISNNIFDELEKFCPNVDAVGINAYGGILKVAEQLAATSFTRPYLITEFGPRGHWEVAKTPWGLPLEDTSTQKADFYLEAYEREIASRPQCLGSYVFLWGNKQEKTHTWYGMFLPDGTRLGVVDAMQYAWTGKWPGNRCPVIKGPIRVEGSQNSRNVFAPKDRVGFAVEVSDPDNDRITIAWDLRRDVSDNPAIGGDSETEPRVLTRATGRTAQFDMPNQPGYYRVFVYVGDGGKRGATANLPIQVNSTAK